METSKTLLDMETSKTLLDMETPQKWLETQTFQTFSQTWTSQTWLAYYVWGVSIANFCLRPIHLTVKAVSSELCRISTWFWSTRAVWDGFLVVCMLARSWTSGVFAVGHQVCWKIDYLYELCGSCPDHHHHCTYYYYYDYYCYLKSFMWVRQLLSRSLAPL